MREFEKEICGDFEVRRFCCTWVSAVCWPSFTRRPFPGLSHVCDRRRDNLKDTIAFVYGPIPFTRSWLCA